MLMPDTDRVIKIHEKLMIETEIQKEKRKNLLRGEEGYNLLDSAINSAFQEVFGEEIYAKPLDKASRVLVGIIKNHPFVDGNKRTAFVVAKEILKENNQSITGYKIEEMVTFLEKIASSQEGIDKLTEKTKDFLERFLIE